MPFGGNCRIECRSRQAAPLRAAFYNEESLRPWLFRRRRPPSRAATCVARTTLSRPRPTPSARTAAS
ncbi:protein of unknown function [Azospirillum baldaniorum]|uniref:Uncharacterized protein n=1 Tax=Azospirillum baldaniorum TaxID=1064539 RepID=A0A9P1JRP4_9PROT|nr:protein of unknown function [Azospirillum baldaniorum]